MAEPDNRDIRSQDRNTYVTETSFIEDSFISEDEDPIVEDFIAVTQSVKFLNEYATAYQYNRENLSSTESSKRAEDIYEMKENTIKRIISARWRLNEYLSSEEQDVQDKFNYLQMFGKDVVTFLKILFLFSSSEPLDGASPEDEVKSKHATLIANPGAEIGISPDQPGGNTCPGSSIATDTEAHKEDDIAILQGIRAEVEHYTQQWVKMDPLFDEKKQVFSELVSDELTHFNSVSFRSLSTRRNVLWGVLGVIGGAVIIIAIIILLLIIIFATRG